MDEFLRFVVERHRIWEQRQAGAPQPWTADPVLAGRKFTNVFRVLDPGTQFLFTDLFDPELSDRDQLMRLFLYRHTGRVEAWQYLDLACGYPTVANLEDVRAAFKEYRGVGKFKLKNLRPVSERADVQAAGYGETVYPRTVFTNAYLVFPQSQARGTDKLDSIIDLALRAFTPGSAQDVMPAWGRAKTQAQRFAALRSPSGVGDFMAMQVLTDWGYTQDVDREDEFLVPGPGSIKGAKALAPNASVGDTVKEVLHRVRSLPDCPRLGYRVPSLMDIGSNLLCEYSKYHRYKQATDFAKAARQPYKPAHPGPQAVPALPSYYTRDNVTNETLEDLL